MPLSHEKFDSSSWTSQDCVKIIAKFFSDVDNDGFPYFAPGAKDQILIPSERLEELREALVVYDNECHYVG